MKYYIRTQFVILLLLNLIIIFLIISAIFNSNYNPEMSEIQNEQDNSFFKYCFVLHNLLIGSIQVGGSFVLLFFNKYRKFSFYHLLLSITITLFLLFLDNGCREYWFFKLEFFYNFLLKFELHFDIIFGAIMTLCYIFAHFHIYFLHKLSKK